MEYNLPNLKGTAISLVGILFIFVVIMVYVNNYERGVNDARAKKEITRESCVTKGGQWVAVSTYSSGKVKSPTYFCSN